MRADATATLPGAANLRDLGGLRGAGGRAIVPCRLYRSSHLAALGEGEARALALRTVVDLRGSEERAAAPARGLHAGVRQLHLPIEPRALADLQTLRAGGAEVEEQAIVQLMHGVYRRFVRERTAVFGALLRELLAADAYPLLFHCTAGKDRTGFAAAVVLLALEVPYEAIEADFLRSNDHWRPTRSDAGWVTLSRVRADYLHTAWQTMQEDWGSVDAYLERALGIDDTARAALQARLLA
jgi:protein-tyrosine phosphatase